MSAIWPKIVLLEGNRDRCRRWESSAKTMGVGCRILAEIPVGSDSGRKTVRILVMPPCAAMQSAIQKAHTAFPCARVIISGIDSDYTSVVDAFRSGADDFVSPGADAEECKALLAKHLVHADGDIMDASDHGLVGRSAVMRDLRARIRRLASSGATVLITGETGTGKECAAALLHRLSRRASGPIIALNCAAIPEMLLEGELFGYERGAFSGATAAYPGKLKLADGGTLFLDEIGELSAAGQAKVLRAIETREIYRLGGRSPTRFDVRIIAATNRNLADERDAGRFREDLYYRLAVAQLHMPPLRERREDIVPIACHLLHELAEASEQPQPRMDATAMAVLESYHWPGNVRELRNALEVAMIQAPGCRIRSRDLPSGLRPAAAAPLSPADERDSLIEALERACGNKSRAAQALNCSRMTLYRKLARYGIESGTDEAGLAVTAWAQVSHGLSQKL